MEISKVDNVAILNHALIAIESEFSLKKFNI